MRTWLSNLLFWAVIALLIAAFVWTAKGWSVLRVTALVVFTIVVGALLNRLTYKIKTRMRP